MAGDWIKMRGDLQSHPKVVRILSATRADKFRVIGGLHAVWNVFDTHSVDGKLSGYTPDALDHIIGWEGFSQAMINVGWLAFDGLETLEMPEFSEHNGQSAKRRAEDQKRKRNSRSSPQGVHNPSASAADKMRTESGLEKRREDIKKILPEMPGFARLWETWPNTSRKADKKKCLDKWRSKNLEDKAEEIIAHVEASKKFNRQWREGYEPAPLTYLNGERWNDGVPANAAPIEKPRGLAL